MRLLRAALNSALAESKILRDMMPGKYLMEGESAPRRLITDDEYAALLAACRDPDYADILVTAWHTGMRISEIATVTASQCKLSVLHFTGQRLSYISLGVFDTKTGAERTIPVGEELKAVLDRRLVGLAPEDPVFTLDGKRATENGIRKRLQTVCARAGVIYGDAPRNAKGDRTGVVFHCFRHTRISRWVEAGYSDEIIRRASGHEDMKSYRKYVHLDARSVMRLVENENVHETLQKPAKLSKLQ